MNKKEMLREIYYETKTMNRNIQRLVNIGLIGILGRSAKEAKDSGDLTRKNLIKAGLILAAVIQVLLMLGDILDYRKKRIEAQLEEIPKDKMMNGIK